jgi:diguanylate cyclase (GGDEF)-like protein
MLLVQAWWQSGALPVTLAGVLVIIGQQPALLAPVGVSLLTAACLLFLLHRMVFRHLEDISRFLGNLNFRHPGKEALQLNRASCNDLLSGMARSVNEVHRHLQQEREEMLRYEHQLEVMLRTDDLTSIPNRYSISERAEKMLCQAGTKKLSLGLFLIDLSDFKAINDSLGHLVGDAALIAVAHRLRSLELEQPGCFVGRYGGDEFVILLESNRHAHFEDTARTLIDMVSRPMQVHGHRIHMGVSIGYSTFPDRSTDVAALFRQADTAMYEAKKAGVNQFRIFDSGLEVALQQRHKIRQALRNAIEEHALNIFFQPIVDAHTLNPECAEVLLRFDTEQLRDISIEDIIAVAEQSGDILDLGAEVIRQSLEQLSEWHARTGQYNIKLAINISSIQFVEPGFLENLIRQMDNYDVPTHCIELEITERLLLESTEQVTALLKMAAGAGIGLSLDDFGTGYSALGYLRSFPFSRLKIDRSFIMECLADKKSRALVETFIHLAHDLNMEVIAEGVETDAQLAFLRHLGCDLIQGYLISKPLGAEDYASRFIDQISPGRYS